MGLVVFNIDGTSSNHAFAIVNMYIKIKNVFFMCMVILAGTSCRTNQGIKDSNVLLACAPNEYYPIDDDVVESFALATCLNGVETGTYNILPEDSLIVVPQGGVHILYILFHSEWVLPEIIPPATEASPGGIEIFAGSCAIDLPTTACLPEFNRRGEPLESNRLPPQILRVDGKTLRIGYILPESPRQVSISLNYCTLWPSDSRLCTGISEGGVGTMLSYTFRYESVAHITLDTQDPNAECDCRK